MISSFDDFAFVEHNNFIGFLDGSKTVGNDDGSTIFGKYINGILNQLFGFGIDGRSGFVQDKNAGIINISTNERNELALPDR